MGPYAEWLLQDRAAIVAQLGLDIREFAFNLATMRQQLGVEAVSAETLDARWAGGPEGDDVEGALAGVVERYLTMWAGGNSGVVLVSITRRRRFTRRVIASAPVSRKLAHSFLATALHLPTAKRSSII